MKVHLPRLTGLWLVLLALIVASPSRAGVLRVERVLNLDGNPDRPIFTQTLTPDAPRGLMVYTHGFTDNSRNHRRLYEMLLARGYAVAAWDMPGHGSSYGMRGYVDDFDDFLRALDMVRLNAVEHLPRGTPVYMAGYSMGGLVTLRYSEIHNGEIAGSFYFSPFLKAHLSLVRRLLNAFSGPLDRILPRVKTPHGVTVPMLLTDPEVLAERKDDPYFFKDMTVHLFRQLLRGIEDTERDSSKMTKPILIQAAGRELIVERSETESFFANLPTLTVKQYQLWPKLEHELDNETGRQQVYDVLSHWLQEREQHAAFHALHGAK